MNRWFALAIVVLALAACSSGSSGDARPTTTSTTASHKSELDSLAAKVGCQAHTVSAIGDDPFDVSGECTRDGDLLRLHVIHVGQEDRARQMLSTRYPTPDELGQCPDGSAPRGPWIVIGGRWVIVTNVHETATTIAALIEGEVLPNDPSQGPPVSYPKTPPGFTCDVH